MARGRKPTKKIVMPGRLTDLRDPLLARTGDPIWNELIYRYTTVPADAPRAARLLAYYQKITLAEMIRLRWDRSISWKGVAREMTKAGVEGIKLEARLMSDLLSLVSEVFLLYTNGYSHPACWFFEILGEHEVIGIFSDTAATKTALVAEAKAVNRVLWDRSANPFVKPATATLFDYAIKMAGGELSDAQTGEQPLFWQQRYRPFVESRRRLINHRLNYGQLALKKEPSSLGYIEGRKRSKKRTTRNLKSK